MDLNSSSDEDDSPVPPAPAPVQAPGPSTVEEEEAWSQTEELDPRTLGVPGLRTLVPGDRVEVLWEHGAFFLPLSCSPTRTRPQAPGLHHVRAGWERGRVKECVLEMRAGRPVIIYRITYNDGEEVTAAFVAHSMGPERSQNSRATAARCTGGRGPAHAPGTASLRGGGRGGRAVRPAVPEHAEK